MKCNRIEDKRSPRYLDSTAFIEATYCTPLATCPKAWLKPTPPLDKAVDNAYGYKPATGKAEGGKTTDAARVAFLFKLYQALAAK